MEEGAIRKCTDRDFDVVWTIINDGADAYRGVIPEDRWHTLLTCRAKNYGMKWSTEWPSGDMKTAGT